MKFRFGSKFKIQNSKFFLRLFLVFILITAWLFGGYPPIWQNPPIPPKIERVRAATIYQRAPNETNITSPISFIVSMDEYIGSGRDSGCNIETATKTYYQGTPYWGLAFVNKDQSDFIAISDELVPSTTLSHTFTKNFPVGTKIGQVIFICSETPDISFDKWYLTQYTGNTLETLDVANPIVITAGSASSTPQ